MAKWHNTEFAWRQLMLSFTGGCIYSLVAHSMDWVVCPGRFYESGNETATTEPSTGEQMPPTQVLNAASVVNILQAAHAPAKPFERFRSKNTKRITGLEHKLHKPGGCTATTRSCTKTMSLGDGRLLVCTSDCAMPKPIRVHLRRCGQPMAEACKT